MMEGRVVICVVVIKVFSPGCPVNAKLPLVAPILDPVKTHINRLGAFLFDFLICKSYGCCVVNLDGSRGLRVAKLF